MWLCELICDKKTPCFARRFFILRLILWHKKTTRRYTPSPCRSLYFLLRFYLLLPPISIEYTFGKKTSKTEHITFIKIKVKITVLIKFGIAIHSLLGKH